MTTEQQPKPEKQTADKPAAAEADRDLTLNKALDEAVSRLPFFKRKAAQWKLRNAEFREGVLAELASKLADSPEMKDMEVRTFAADGPPAGAAGPNAAVTGFADMPIGIDVSKIEQLLDLVLRYLPQIIDLITKLFPKS